MGHDERVSAEVVEEVSVDRHLLDMQDLGEQLGEGVFEGSRALDDGRHLTVS